MKNLNFRLVKLNFAHAGNYYFRNYDPIEDFERMRKLGLFQGAPPDEVIEEARKMGKFKN